MKVRIEIDEEGVQDRVQGLFPLTTPHSPLTGPHASTPSPSAPTPARSNPA
jgi:hypothetical protein